MAVCGFLTIADRDGWFIDDDRAHAPLQSLGWEVREVPWDAEGVDWNGFEGVVIRSTWDYQHRLPAFFSVLEQIEASRARLFNSLETVKWNADKSYLFQLQRAGVEIVPTELIQSPTLADLKASLSQTVTREIMVKPLVGANADDTFYLDRNATDERFRDASHCFGGRPCLVQPFMPQITQEGEFSLIYFDGSFSHAILKMVKPGDYRVQEEHGGQVVAVSDPEPELIAAAEKVMAAIPDSPLYARVDLVRTPANRFALMEVELIEPGLYFRFDDAAPARFARALERRLRHPS